MKKTIAALLAAAAIGAAAPTLAADIIVVAHGQANDPFWSVVKNGVEKAAQDTGATVDYRSPETFDMVAMSQLIDAAVNQEPDGLVVSIPDADALGPSIQRAVEAGIPVISMNSGSDVSKELGALLHVGQDERDAGEIAGQALAEMGGTKGICVNQLATSRSTCAARASSRGSAAMRSSCPPATILPKSRPRCAQPWRPTRTSTRCWRSAHRRPASPRSRR